VRDEREGELRSFVIGIVSGPKTGIAAITGTAGDFVDVGQNDLVTVTVRGSTCATVENEIEPQLERIDAHEEVTDLAAEAIAPILIGSGEIGEAPVA